MCLDGRYIHSYLYYLKAKRIALTFIKKSHVNSQKRMVSKGSLCPWDLPSFSYNKW